MGQLDGRVCIITGAAQGIGREYAIGAAREGAKVVVADVADPQSVVDELTALGAESVGAVTDITDEAQTQGLAQTTVDAFGRIDVLVNNAALYGALTPTPALQLSVDEWDLVMRVNLRGMFLMNKAVAPVMQAQEYGKIINISSGTALKGTAMFLHYVTSKAGVIGMTRALAREWGPSGIRVNAITPGFTMSDGSKNLQKSFGHEKPVDPTLADRCIRREQEPEDLVGTMIFLASAASDFITAQTINCDGGWVAI